MNLGISFGEFYLFMSFFQLSFMICPSIVVLISTNDPLASDILAIKSCRRGFRHKPDCTATEDSQRNM